MWTKPFLDPVHGSVAFDADLSTLIRTPVLQRLRHVRLSNIDSLDMPSIANVSRFEHVLGVAYLASQVGFRGSLNRYDDLVLRAAALLHDWAITSFGHLVEEALQYVGASFDHEQRLSDIVFGEGPDEILGADLQIFLGREAGIRQWARKMVGSDANRLLNDITNHIRGRGHMGRTIAGTIDLDNIDNVYRMAFHMGLRVDMEAPRRLARSMGQLNEAGEVIFRRDALSDIEAWRATRRTVYQHLMLAENDFVGKMMILYAAIRAYEANEIAADDWKLVDHEFLTRLLQSNVKDVRDAAGRWAVGELWDSVSPRWISGTRPTYPELRAFSIELTAAINRPCFVYGIKDKRDRRLIVSFDDGSRTMLGADSTRWLVGIGSPRRKPFSAEETGTVLQLVCEQFSGTVLPSDDTALETQATLF